MRVTSNTFPNTVLDQLNRLTLRQNRLQQQAATGQRVEMPEDNPNAMRRVLDLQAEANGVGQYEKNSERLKEVTTASYVAVKGLKKVLDRAGEIATLADGTKSPDDLRNYATELSQLIKQTVQLANSKHRGNFLFAGTLTDAPPFQATTNAAGDVTAVSYAGNTTVMDAEVAEGVTVSPFVVGANSTGVGPRGLLVDSAVGADVFGHLISLHNNLLSGNTTAIRDTDRPNLNRDEDNFLYQIGTNGAVQARLESAAAISKQRGESIERLVSSETDADLAQTVVRLTEAQTAYRAALQSSATMLNQSLLDYLR